MIDLVTFEWLLTEQGREITAIAQAGNLSDAARLREIMRLRKLTTPTQAAAAYETAVLRRRAQAKFPQAAQMFFIREALEQASGSAIAAYRATRYTQIGATTIADLCCGIGGDTLALARVAAVIAVDNDPLRLAIAQANAIALGQEQAIVYQALDLETKLPPVCDAIFFDPARRMAGKRIFELADYRPQLTHLRQWQQHTPEMGVKLAPGIAEEELAWLGPAEFEYISVGGDLKEAVVWLGKLGNPGKRATLITRQGEVHSLYLPFGEAQAQVRLVEPQRFLIEPDLAIIRAGLVQLLATHYNLAQIDREIAYLTSEQAVQAPFVRSWQIIEWMPFHLKRIQTRLRELDAGSVTVKKRGSPLETDLLARRLSGNGKHDLTLVLTFVAGRPAALICELIGSEHL